jgi:hypothetical protein
MNDRPHGLQRGRWSRRRLLQVSTGSTAALVAGSMAAGWSLRGATVPTLAVRLIALVPSRESAAAIGREYLRAAPDEAVTESLVRSLVQRSAGLASPENITDAELRALLDASCRLDFAEGDIVRVRGWLLSRTEARTCALAALAVDAPCIRPPETT